MSEIKKAINCPHYSAGYCVFYSKKDYTIVCFRRFGQHFSECKRQGIEGGETS